jgi:bacillithiol synthase
MNCTATSIPYQQTGYFSKIITDYLDNSPALQPFFQHTANINGIKNAIEARKQFSNNRSVLVNALKQQYATMPATELVQKNIELLLSNNTFTICTAHQPAIFTGTLYFVYKILHAIQLANYLKKELPEYNFVPLFWMGSEDADLDELGKIYLSNDKIVWDTKQTGAVGRMNTKGLEKIITRIEGELSVQQFGKELIQIIKDAYLHSPDIQTATFKLLHSLFAQYGLVVLIPDNATLKTIMAPVFEDDLFKQQPSSIVAKSVEALHKAGYKVQANPRDINLFYLKEGLRGRIDKKDDQFVVNESAHSFSEKELLTELNNHPENFSPNVILRGLFQETILPNIAFIGGGGETAYWLELKELFKYYKVPFPVLVLRNSFLIVEKKWQEKMKKNGFAINNFFQTEQQLLTNLVKEKANGQLQIDKELQAATDLYKQLKIKAGAIDKTLQQHIEALQAKALKPMKELEKKMLRAEKRKYEDEQRQIHAIKAALFPLNGLQERIDNFMPYYAKWGKEFIDILLRHSLHLQQQFVVLEEE